MTISFCSCSIICAWLINLCAAYTDTVDPPIQVEGFIGGSAVLPCASGKLEHNFKDIDVSWRYDDSLNVYEIKEGKRSTEHQDPVFKNRIQATSGENEKTNFSLILKNLTHRDAGKYQCYKKHLSELVTIQLLINETTEAIEKPRTPEDGNHAGERKRMMILIPLFFFTFVCFFASIAFILRTRCDKTSGSSPI